MASESFGGKGDKHGPEIDRCESHEDDSSSKKVKRLEFHSLLVECR